MKAAEIQTLMQREFPNYHMKVESCEEKRARIILSINNSHLRPGGTVSGPTMMLLADLAMYAAILNTIGSVVLAVTTNLNINFLRKPKPDRNLVGDSKLMKVGKRLIVGEVSIYSEDDPEPVAHATCTYSVPPKSF
ncbi:MAG: phenylacetic acid degradation protein [Deltaproteobacteria bacterium]|nr:phenylacetic acid degradation protein [Deltaproteobacteria bacterium]|tara:strand:- start:1248 stop:1655 length:408 start_codon:yes stop_codon:yes gene_type:complete